MVNTSIVGSLLDPGTGGWGGLRDCPGWGVWVFVVFGVADASCWVSHVGGVVSSSCYSCAVFVVARAVASYRASVLNFGSRCGVSFPTGFGVS